SEVGVVAGLLLGAGCCLVMWSFTSPAPVTRPSQWQRRLADLLVQAGAPGVTPAALLGAAGLLAATTGALVAATTRAPAIASCFALMAAYSPVALVRGRARRRRAALRALWPDVVDHLTAGIRAGLSLPEAPAQVG
ncbi:MAG TPA: type II secretion system protein F, partial [Actinotalea sp.]|nr:type II secretion system protein F [Actinotalea sp.]